MTQRSVATVILLPLVTFGIYAIYWYVSTKNEMNQRGADIPSAWLLIVPIAGIYWLYCYYKAAEQATSGAVSGIGMFIISLIGLSLIASAICQSSYNKLAAAPQPPTNPVANQSS